MRVFFRCFSAIPTGSSQCCLNRTVDTERICSRRTGPLIRKHSILNFIISVVLASDIQIALAADETTTKYDTPENRASLGLNEDWIPDSENYMRHWVSAAEIQKVLLKADAAYKAGNYRAALKFVKVWEIPLSGMLYSTTK